MCMRMKSGGISFQNYELEHIRIQNFNQDKTLFFLLSIKLKYFFEQNMEDLLSLNSSTTKKEAKVKKFDNLNLGEYVVKSFKLKETNFGLRVFVEVDNFYLTLPPRFSDKINSAEQIAELNEKKFKMIYGGKDVDEFNKLIIDFVQLKQSEDPIETEVIETQRLEDDTDMEMNSSQEFEFVRTVKRKLGENSTQKQYANKKLRK